MAIYHFNRAIVRRPSYSVVDGLSAANLGKPSFDAIMREHAAYVLALNEAGVSLDNLRPLETHPDSIFVEDTALVFTSGAIVLRPGARSREGEAPAMKPELERCFERVLELDDGHADGGDILHTPGKILIGLSSRTDRAGAAALIELLAKLGYSGKAVTTPPGVLHFKSDCSLLDEETVLATATLAVSDGFSDLRVLTVPTGEEAAANALRINDRILLSAGHPRTAELLEKSGYKIVLLETSEIAKLDAGLSCMSLRWRS